MKDDPRNNIDEQLLARLAHKAGRTAGALRSTTQALLNGADKDPALRRELLQAMEFELIELQRVLDNVVQLKALEKGTASPVRRSVLLGPWLRQLAGRWQRMQADKAFTWRIDVPDTLGPIHVDEDRLEQGVNNLLANTVRRARPGSTVSVKASMDREWLLLSVTCDQLSLSPEEYDRACDLLHVSGAEGRFPVSTGLGLYVTRQWLRQEGGDLVPVLPPAAHAWGGFAMRLPLAGSAPARAQHLEDLTPNPGDPAPS